jgi:transposase
VPAVVVVVLLVGVEQALQGGQGAGLAGLSGEPFFEGLSRPGFGGDIDYPGGCTVMAAPKKYPDELRERATRLVVEAKRDPVSRVGAVRRIADQLGVHPEALRVWVRRAETDGGLRPGVTSAEAQRVADLEREVRELRRANQILKSAASFFAAELDRPSR